MRLQFFKCLSAFGVIAAAACAAPVTADIIPIESDTANSEAGLGEFIGTIEYNGGAGSGTLVITLTNTSNPLNGGFLTGFAFNIDSMDPAVTASLTSSSHPAMTGFMDQEASPFGMFKAGAATGGDWNGGHGPSGGIGVNDTGVFTFEVTASDAAALSASSFILAGPNEFGFVTRFHAFLDDDSDKVPGKIVPAPGPIALLLLGGLIGAGRTRRTDR